MENGERGMENRESGRLDERERMQALDELFASASILQAPVRLQAKIMARLERRERARRVLTGGVALALGTVALSVLVFAPALLGLLSKLNLAPALISGGPQTLAQLMALLQALARALLVLWGQLAVPLVLLALMSLALALALNMLWIGTMRRLRTAQG